MTSDTERERVAGEIQSVVRYHLDCVEEMAEGAVTNLAESKPAVEEAADRILATLDREERVEGVAWQKRQRPDDAKPQWHFVEGGSPLEDSYAATLIIHDTPSSSEESCAVCGRLYSEPPGQYCGKHWDWQPTRPDSEDEGDGEGGEISEEEYFGGTMEEVLGTPEPTRPEGEHPRAYICENCEANVNLRYIPCPACGESLAPTNSQGGEDG